MTISFTPSQRAFLSQLRQCPVDISPARLIGRCWAVGKGYMFAESVVQPLIDLGLLETDRTTTGDLIVAWWDQKAIDDLRRKVQP